MDTSICYHYKHYISWIYMFNLHFCFANSRVDVFRLAQLKVLRKCAFQKELHLSPLILIKLCSSQVCFRPFSHKRTSQQSKAQILFLKKSLLKATFLLFKISSYPGWEMSITLFRTQRCLFQTY